MSVHISTASIGSITSDNGNSSSDFITNDPTLVLNGSVTATGSGTPAKLGIWISGGGFGHGHGGKGTLVGYATVDLSGTWTYDLTTSSVVNATSLSNGTYDFQITDGTSNNAAVLASQTVIEDTKAPKISHIVVAGDNHLTQPEDVAGFDVTGKAKGADGQTITVQILHGSDVIATETGTVVNGGWTVSFPGNEPIGAGNYSVLATVSDVAGNSVAQTRNFNSTACFMPGTQIQCPQGDMSVETLEIGDLVLTADGKVATVRWIGRQTVSLLFADKLRTLPIRIRAGALAENVPSRDFLLSPDHAVLVDDVLVQAGALVNGKSIVRETDVPQVFTYYHVELDGHSLILAENVPAETFIDNVDRMAFDNWQEHEGLYPEGKSLVELQYPRAKAHRQVPSSIRAKLEQRARTIGAISDARAA